MAEQRTFVFSIVFIILFAGIVSAIPTDLQGQGEEPDIVTPLNPALIAGFETTENWSMVALSAYDQYMYTLNLRDWLFSHVYGTLQLGAKVYTWIFWFGTLDSCEFINTNGTSRGTVLSTAEINADATEGAVRYELRYLIDGADAGGFIVYWNSTLYTSVGDAFTADEVYFLHGVGLSSTASPDAVSLLLGLLLMRLPDCPPLINLILATPIYACVIFLIWFIIKESLPFV